MVDSRFVPEKLGGYPVPRLQPRRDAYASELEYAADMVRWGAAQVAAEKAEKRARAAERNAIAHENYMARKREAEGRPRPIPQAEPSPLMMRRRRRTNAPRRPRPDGGAA